MRGFSLRWIDRAHIALGSVSGLCILAIMAIVTPDVIARKTVSYTIPGAAELNTLLLVTLIYLGLAAAEAKRAHFVVTLLTDSLTPRYRHIAAIISTLVSLGYVGFLAWLTTLAASKSFLSGETTFGVVSFPVWPSRIAVALGLSLLTLQLLVELIRLLGGRPAHVRDRKGAGQ